MDLVVVASGNVLLQIRLKPFEIVTVVSVYCSRGSILQHNCDKMDRVCR